MTERTSTLVRVLHVTIECGVDKSEGNCCYPIKDGETMRQTLGYAFVAASDTQPSPYVRDVARAMYNGSLGLIYGIVSYEHFDSYSIVHRNFGVRVTFRVMRRHATWLTRDKECA